MSEENKESQEDLAQYVKDNIQPVYIEAPSRPVGDPGNEVPHPNRARGCMEHMQHIDELPYFEEPVTETTVDVAPAEIPAMRTMTPNEMFIEWMRMKHPKNQFVNTAQYSIYDILSGLPLLSQSWKVVQLGMFYKQAQKFFQATFMPYLMDGETPSFLTSQLEYLAYVILQDSVITFNIHMIVPQGTDSAVQPPYPTKGLPACVLKLIGIPDLGAAAMEIKVIRESDANLRILPTPLISMTQVLTGQNIQGIARGVGGLRYKAPPQAERRPPARKATATSLAALATAMAFSTPPPLSHRPPSRTGR